MDGEQRGGRLGSFVVGGVLGASAALAAALAAARRRRRLAEPARPVFQGLEAFEGAPCYREVVDKERERDELEP
jgi:hypothetical protein